MAQDRQRTDRHGEASRRQQWHRQPRLVAKREMDRVRWSQAVRTARGRRNPTERNSQTPPVRSAEDPPGRQRAGLATTPVIARTVPRLEYALLDPGVATQATAYSGFVPDELDERVARGTSADSDV